MLLQLLFWGLLTPDEKTLVKENWKSFCERHLIADMPPELEELERRLDEEEHR